MGGVGDLARKEVFWYTVDLLILPIASYIVVFSNQHCSNQRDRILFHRVYTR